MRILKISALILYGLALAAIGYWAFFLV